MTKQTNYKSKCCNAPVKVEGEVTKFYVCQKCLEDCAVVKCDIDRADKLKQLTKAIQEDVPEIIKRQFGCKVFVKGIREDNSGCEYDVIVDERIKNGKITLGYFGNVPLTEIEIIGRPITLEDIMIILDKLNLVYNSDGYAIYIFEDSYDEEPNSCDWKPNTPLHQQDQETIDLLYKLIVKK